ncbi:glycosyltransferase [Modestobacter sp. SYSU DS0875]
MTGSRATTLLVANDGGHITQLFDLHERLPFSDSVVWCTIKTEQTVSLLSGRVVEWFAPSPPKDWRTALRNMASAKRLFAQYNVQRVVSTGSALAVAIMPAARLRGIDCIYLESATRVDAPSLTGRVMAALPGVRTYTQNPAWESNIWRYAGSIFDGFKVEPDATASAPKTVLLTLGTARDFPFRALVERMLAIVPSEVDVIWQTGSTDVSDLPIVGHDRVPSETMQRWSSEADAVVAHAGTGSALTSLRAGNVPLLVARNPSRGEHIDDHQLQIAQMLAERGLARSLSVEELTWEDIVMISRLRAVRTQPPTLAI